jgi:hypothetical protein
MVRVRPVLVKPLLMSAPAHRLAVVPGLQQPPTGEPLPAEAAGQSTSG